MAGDWIKMRTDLFTHPKVYAIAERFGKDELWAVGALFAFWSWTDKHCVDGRVDGATSRLVDRATGVPGFADALVSVGWLVIDAAGISIPEFSEHNGDSAKERVLKNQRQARWRERKADGIVDANSSTTASTKSSTREEKRREEEKKGSASAKPISRAIEIDTWLDSLPEGSPPISADDPIVAYAEKTGIPIHFLDLAWDCFAAAYRAKHKRQKDWPGTFGNAVKGNWYKLWWFTPDGKCQLTTPGEQAKRAAA